MLFVFVFARRATPTYDLVTRCSLSTTSPSNDNNNNHLKVKDNEHSE